MMSTGSGGWCAPSESIYTVILGEDYAGDFLMLTPRTCLPCTQDIEHPRIPECVDND